MLFWAWVLEDLSGIVVLVFIFLSNYLFIIIIEDASDSLSLCYSKINPSTSQTTSIRPLPHMFVVKDLIPVSNTPWLTSNPACASCTLTDVGPAVSCRCKVDSAILSRFICTFLSEKLLQNMMCTCYAIDPSIEKYEIPTWTTIVMPETPQTDLS